MSSNPSSSNAWHPPSLPQAPVAVLGGHPDAWAAVRSKPVAAGYGNEVVQPEVAAPSAPTRRYGEEREPYPRPNPGASLSADIAGYGNQVAAGYGNEVVQPEVAAPSSSTRRCGEEKGSSLQDAPRCKRKISNDDPGLSDLSRDSERKAEQMMTAFYEVLADDCPLNAFWTLVPKSVSEVEEFYDFIDPDVPCLPRHRRNMVDIQYRWFKRQWSQHADLRRHFQRYWDHSPDELSETFLPSRAVLNERLSTLWHKQSSDVRDALGGKKEGLLPLALYCGDTAYMVELFRRMKTLSGCCPTAAAVRKHLGPYACVARRLVTAGRAVRQAIVNGRAAKLNPAQAMRAFLEKRLKSMGIPCPSQRLAARGIWVTPGQELASLSHFNFASFSLHIQGAAAVLDLYEACVDEGFTTPLFLLAQQDEILSQGLVTHPFYFETSDDAGAPNIELEVVLPPFAKFIPAGAMSLWPATAEQTLEKSRVHAVANAWGLSPEDAHQMLDRSVAEVHHQIRVVNEDRNEARAEGIRRPRCVPEMSVLDLRFVVLGQVQSNWEPQLL